MARHVQRKCFDHPDFAFETASGFKDFNPSIPGMVNVTAEVREIDGEFWVYVVSDGPLVGDDGEPLLPDYELVS